MKFRENVLPQDIEAVRRIVTSSGFFNDEEIDMAAELVHERVEKGIASGYEFLFGDVDGKTLAYSCFGRITGTAGSYDLYWIAVENEYRSHGIGQEVLIRTEKLISKAKGYKIYVETSSQEKYAPTRKFYLKAGYILEGCLKDFYAIGDDKHIYTKKA